LSAFTRIRHALTGCTPVGYVSRTEGTEFGMPVLSALVVAGS
jgi:hypothetical protein